MLATKKEKFDDTDIFFVFIWAKISWFLSAVYTTN